MIKEWMSVVYWRNGRAILQHSSNSIYTSYLGCSTCGFCVFNTNIFNTKIVPKISYQLELLISQPLVVGQQVEVGMLEVGLLYLAMLVYIIPLFGLFIIGVIMEFLFSNQLIIFLGAILGAGISFFL